MSPLEPATAQKHDATTPPSTHVETSGRENDLMGGAAEVMPAVPPSLIIEAMRHVAFLCCVGLETGRLQLYQIPFSVWIFLAHDNPNRIIQLSQALRDILSVLERRVRMRYSDD